jgi:hypothetical protein
MEHQLDRLWPLMAADRRLGPLTPEIGRHDHLDARASDLMRRMVKENLLKFDATPLFPERLAYTVPHKLSDAEARLYKAVTMREEFNRAEALENGVGTRASSRRSSWSERQERTEKARCSRSRQSRPRLLQQNLPTVALSSCSI